jgi:acyl-CoA synthetase (AMP-forming)/AMP-acid ligase II
MVVGEEGPFELGELLRPILVAEPDRVALISGDQSWSYAALDKAASRLAEDFRQRGLAPGDCVALLMPSVPELLACFLACWKARLVAVSVYQSFSAVQLRYVLRHSGSRALIVESQRLADFIDDPELSESTVEHVYFLGDHVPSEMIDLAEVLRSSPPLDWPDPPTHDAIALLVYTSGTTSRPKGVAHSARRLAYRIEAMRREARITRDDVSLATMLTRPVSLFWSALAILRAGGTAALLPDYTPEAFWQVYRSEPAKTFLIASPGMLVGLLQHPRAREVDHRALRLWLCGGDTIQPGTARRFREITGHELTVVCGMTEAGSYTINLAPETSKRGSLGRPFAGVRLRVVRPDGQDASVDEVGEVLIHSPDLMVGYWNDTVRTFDVLRDLWLHTGDLVRRDADGYLWFVGRQRDMICRGGFKVAPAMVEEAIVAHPAIAAAIVVGVSDTEFGQAIHAFLESSAGHARPALAELRSFLSTRIEATAIPTSCAWIEHWPLTQNGKVDRPRLVWMAEAGDTEL